MARFSYDDDIIVADCHGEVSYDDALNGAVDNAVSAIEMALWDLVDELEYIIGEEVLQPTEDE